MIDRSKVIHRMLLLTIAGLAAGARPPCTVSPVDSMFKLVLADATPTDLSQLIPLTTPLAAARGETVHFQALVALNFPQPTVSLAVTLDAPNGIEVSARAVRYLSLNKVYDPDHVSGFYPDPLVPPSAPVQPTPGGGFNFTFATPDLNVLPTNSGVGALLFWVTLNVSSSAAAGTHTGIFTLNGPGLATAGTPVECVGDFKVSVSKFTLPSQPTQLTGAQFEPQPLEAFSAGGEASVSTVLNHFKSFSAQEIDTLVWFELDELPWAPTYGFNADRTAVTLNTTAHEEWWPQVLSITGARHWRMPFSNRVNCHVSHQFPDNCTWMFHDVNGSVFSVPIFEPPSSPNATTAVLNPEFQRLFTLLFKEVLVYLDRMGWTEQGAWVMVTDEPSWNNAATARNTLALIRAYHQVSPDIRVYQTRVPVVSPDPKNPAPATTAVAEALFAEVDWWCPHVCQWMFPSVPEHLAEARRNRTAAGKPFFATVYDNGVPLIESPWQRVRYQAYNVWASNGTLDGTLSWYNINSIIPCTTEDVHVGNCTSPWYNPYLPSPGKGWPAGWGALIYPPPLVGDKNPLPPVWAPVESIRWVMLGAGIRDTEYAYALEKLHSTQADDLLKQLRALSPAFSSKWNPLCGDVTYGDDGYMVEPHPLAGGSSAINAWKLAAAALLDSRA